MAASYGCDEKLSMLFKSAFCTFSSMTEALTACTPSATL